MIESFSLIVIGEFYTDLAISGIEEFAETGKSARAKTFSVQAGGKARNVAHMAAILSKPKSVAMIAKTSQDKFGLWKVPLDALKESGVNTDHVQVLSAQQTKKAPGVVFVLVDKMGRHQLYGARGIIDDFNASDIDKAESLFKEAEKQALVMVSCIIPLDSVLHSIKKANKYGLRIMVDPGGLYNSDNPAKLLESRAKIFFLKPNEREVEVLTGINVRDFVSAKKAAKKLLDQKIQNVLITHGKNGAYFFNAKNSVHIKIPTIEAKGIFDETGCGDQTMAAICSALLNGQDVLSASKLGVIAGTLQFHKAGIVPVTKNELQKALQNV